MSAAALLAAPQRHDVIVLIHPNNPGGDRFDTAQLLRLHAGLAARGGWLVVDEAFMDATPAHSLCAQAGADGLMIEAHPNPDHALSDGAQSLSLEEFAALTPKMRAVAEAVGRTLSATAVTV